MMLLVGVVKYDNGCGLANETWLLSLLLLNWTMSSSASLRSYTLSEVASHNTADSLWLIIEDKVYDVTAFKAEVS